MPLRPIDAETIAHLGAALGYTFTNPELVLEALTHKSYIEERKGETAASYERLEFLGDRVLGLCIAAMLFEAYPNAPEGELARRFSSLVSRASCAQVFAALALSKYIRLGGSAEKLAGRKNPALLADVCEALIGALFVDGGVHPARTFIERHWQGLLQQGNTRDRDAKTALQEWGQGRGLPLPVYSEHKRSGPDHAPIFFIEVTLEGFPPATGEGATKKAATRAAAEAFLAREGLWPDKGTLEDG